MDLSKKDGYDIRADMAQFKKYKEDENNTASTNRKGQITYDNLFTAFFQECMPKPDKEEPDPFYLYRFVFKLFLKQYTPQEIEAILKKLQINIDTNLISGYIEESLDLLVDWLMGKPDLVDLIQKKLTITGKEFNKKVLKDFLRFSLVSTK